MLLIRRLRLGWAAISLAPIYMLGWAQAPSRPQATPAAKAALSPDALYRAGYEAYNKGDLATAHARFSKLVALAPQVPVGHLAYGQVLLAEGQPAAALKELERARELDPKSAPAAIVAGKAWVALGQPDKAAAAFREALAAGAVLAPEDTLSYATALAETGHREEAASALQSALAEGSGSALTSGQKALLEDASGSLLAQGGALEEAQKHFSAAIAADPGLASAHAHLGSALLAQRRSDSAVPELRQAIALASGEAGYAVELGRALYASGQDGEAVSVLRGAVALADRQAAGAKADDGRRPRNIISSQARYTLALALQANGQLAEALPLFAASAAAEPANTEALTNYALALVQTGDAKHALTLYQQALDHGPDNATLREDYGVAYLQQSDLDHALEQFTAGLKLEPENPHLHYDLGLAWKLKDNLAAAIPEFERAEALDPALPDPPYTLGVIHMQQGEFAAAAAQLEKAVALQPQNAAAWSVLGNVYKQSDEPGKAAQALQRAIELAPDQPSTHISLAAILAQNGDQAGAAAERKQAAELSRVAVSRQRASFALKSGRALLEQGKVKEAEAQLRTAIAADPDDPAAHLALAEALTRDGQQAGAAVEREQAAKLAGAK